MVSPSPLDFPVHSLRNSNTLAEIFKTIMRVCGFTSGAAVAAADLLGMIQPIFLQRHIYVSNDNVTIKTITQDRKYRNY